MKNLGEHSLREGSMASNEMVSMIQASIRRELQVVIQYMWQHVTIKGFRGIVVGEKLEEIALQEMKHAEQFAELLDYLGEGDKLPTEPDPIRVGSSYNEMIEQDLKDERYAVELYGKAIAMAREEGLDRVRWVYMRALAEEEDHLRFFEDALED
jgi:bacterioferritin